MAAHGRSALRDLFDESPTPHIAHPPRTHHRDFYVATDGSFRDSGGGLGAVIETRDGTRVARIATADTPPDNNVAEYRALHLGLDVLAARAPRDARVGVLVDHDTLASNVNNAILATNHPDRKAPRPLSVPRETRYHWRGIEARLNGFGEVRAARIDSDQNPAHPLANTPDRYRHVNHEPDRCVLPDPLESTTQATEFPPPSRADRNGSTGGGRASD
ncbi:reverse transcriptase-like protein [Natronolimnobius sp. AArcel1]|uniref:reverse transcriptase-like protein n=1 Tax=Natronolimnobius sp. AArcel1 TaxID=1679093 RepID=UPI0013EDEDE1|nr:reverse transcriptase-like protein [Natronolimnobius sp. AArcel1]NGM69123.1 reverse transcriptase-like protein [Natronolimnobius sp. AArcel1]